ncbi:unnamed protein product [Linum tenue]|uniref:Disease resistance RPP13-like protein 1 n=1 Tax=Linum tenue TaxID=586396 RepID=A0AAV0PRN6_9ROSI|nr:unnamed protein product [Linum tenue]
MEVVASVGGALLSESLKLLIEKLGSHDFLKYFRQAQVVAELNSWASLLKKIYAVLDDAEEKQMTSRLVSIWATELRDLAYDAEDVLDSFATEQLQRKIKAETASASTSKGFSAINPRTLKFNAEMVSKVREITVRLQKISAEKNHLDLKEIVGTKLPTTTERLPTTSLVNESKVYGRDEDWLGILELLRANQTDVDVSVIPIIGMGGLGKTTLAQLVLSRAKSEFDVIAWVSVGEDFDVHRITKTILGSDGSGCNDLNSLQEKLKEKLSGKKFLIVLDDVWNEDYQKWVLCRAPLETGALGSKILVTTRNSSVSSIMGTFPPYLLKELAFNDCLHLFADHALGTTAFTAHSYLEEMAKEIVKRCRGLPLAIKALGGMLRGKQNPKQWEEVLYSKIWDLPETNGILPALRLSYHHLPSNLKRCFGYCAILPKDMEFEEDELVLLWLAEGFLVQRKHSEKSAKNLGHKYFHDLLSRSFFQQASDNPSRFTMHDLMNDLAEYESKGICLRLDDKLEDTASFPTVRYSSFRRHKYDLLQRFGVFAKLKNLRSLSALPFTTYSDDFLSYKVLLELVPKLKYLRVLSLAGYKMEELPDVVFTLKQLRYLNLSGTDIVGLSELVGELFNLQTLRLHGCQNLVKLPRSIGNLINLQWLDNSNTVSLQELPAEVAKLTNLTILPKVLVGKGGKGFRIVDLKNLSQLQGKLHIQGLCSNFMNIQDAEVADLKGKQDLDDLGLEWCTDSQCSHDETVEVKVLNLLRPHWKLKKLSIKFYGGVKFPVWVGDPTFAAMVHLELLNCRKIRSVPLLGQLSLLTTLRLSGMNKVKEIGGEFYGNNICTGSSLPCVFPALETLCIEDMPEWEKWSCPTECFPKLVELTIGNCPKLIGNLPNSLPCLQRLNIRGCQQMADLPETLASLSALSITECNKLILRNGTSMESLTTLRITKILKLVNLQEVMIHGLGALSFLKELGIDDCEDLMFLGEGPLPSSLEFLRLNRCPKLEKFPDVLHNLTHLKTLEFQNCQKLVSLSERGLPSSLSRVWISCCDSLKSFLISNMNYADNRNAERPSQLEELTISGCSSLTILPSTCPFPGSLKHLSICSLTTQSLEDLLHHPVLPLLTELSITHSPELERFPERELLVLQTLTRLRFFFCENLRSLPNQLPHLTSLRLLEIILCESLESFPEGGLPLNLIMLTITNCKSLKQPISDWKLNRLTSLKRLSIVGECPSTQVASFPDDEGLLLPTSLTFIHIAHFSELKSISKGLMHLNCLEELVIWHCPKLRSLPDEGLPPSLGCLKLYECPLLKPKCAKQKGEYWPIIHHIPCVAIDTGEAYSYGWSEP